MSFRSLFHVHTRYSPDSLLSPARILAEARRCAVDVLIVTDHDTVQGSREVQTLAVGNPKFVPTAAEYQTEKGDIIGVFLKEEIRPGRSDDVIQQIREQGGLVVLPHPYKAHQLDDHLLAQVDLIEVHNSRCSKSENALAMELAGRLGRPSLGGADAHCAHELGAVLNHFSAALPLEQCELCEALLRAPRDIEFQRVSGVYRSYSQMIRAMKTRDPVLFLSQSKRLAVTWIRESWRQLM